MKAMVRSDAKLTDYANFTSGVKQGDGFSPVLFSLFKNELALVEIENRSHGAALIPGVIELFILLLADDIVFYYLKLQLASKFSIELHVHITLPLT